MANAQEDVSHDALEVVVENVAVHLNDTARQSFAAKLPEELHTAATMVPTASNIDEDIIEQFMELEDVTEHQARTYLQAAWQTVCELFDHESLAYITSSLPHRLIAVLEH